MSCGKADALLFGLYLCLCAACFFPKYSLVMLQMV